MLICMSTDRYRKNEEEDKEEVEKQEERKRRERKKREREIMTNRNKGQ